MSKIRNNTNPKLTRTRDSIFGKDLNFSRHKIKTNGIAVNSSQITSLGSTFLRINSARLVSGIPKTNKEENIMLISQLEKEVEQRIIKKKIVPKNDPNVPGAGSFFPIKPRVARFLTSQSII